MLPNVPKSSLCSCLLTYIPYHILPSLTSLLNAPHTLPKRSKNIQTFPQRFKTLHNAAKQFYAYHTIPYQMGLCSPYNNTHHKNHTYEWDRPGNLHEVLHVLQLQTNSISRCVCVSCKKHAGNLYLSATFGKMQDSIIGSIVFLKPWCDNYYLTVEDPKPLPNAHQNTQWWWNRIHLEKQKNEPSQPLKQVT